MGAGRGDRWVGKLAGLRQLASEHWPAIEADLQRYYGVDARDVWVPGSDLSWRRFGVLVDHLPVESSTVLAVEGAAAVKWARWDNRTELAAATVDALGRVGALIVGAATGEVPPLRPPVPRPRKPAHLVDREQPDPQRQYPAALAQLFGVPFNPHALPPGGEN